jgi:uncharacterized protein
MRADSMVNDTFGYGSRLIVSFEVVGAGGLDPVALADYREFFRMLSARHNLRMLLYDPLFRARYDASGGKPYLLAEPSTEWVVVQMDSGAVMRRMHVDRGKSAVFLELPALSPGAVTTIQEEVARVARQLNALRPGRYKIRVLGTGITLQALGASIENDLRRLIPVVVLVILGIFVWLFRSPVACLLGVLDVGASTVWALAVLRWRGCDLSLMTAIVPLLLMAIGIADEIHLYNEFVRCREHDPETPPGVCAERAARHVMLPMLLTATTSAGAFFSFLLTDIPALQYFGLVAGVGVCASFLLTQTVVPLGLAVLPVGALRMPSLPSSWSLPRRLRALPMPWLVTAAALPGCWWLRIDDGWSHNFPPTHPVVLDAQWYQRVSVGLHRFDVVLTQPADRAWTDSDALARLERLCATLRTQSGVAEVLSMVDLLAERRREVEAQSRPHAMTTDDIARTFRMFNEEIFLRQFLDESRRRTRLMVFIARDDYEGATLVRRHIEQATKSIAGPGIQLTIGGSAERGRVMIESILRTQGTSLAAEVVILVVALGLLTCNWSRAARCVGAVVWAVVLVLGVAGWLRIPLGVASSCFVTLALGIGVDYSIHLAYGRALASNVHDLSERVLESVLVVGVGFAVLLLSSNPTIRHLGILLLLSMVASAYTAIVILTKPSAVVRNQLLNEDNRLEQPIPAL